MSDSNRKAKHAKRNSGTDHSLELPGSNSSTSGSDEEVEVLEGGKNKKNLSRVLNLSEASTSMIIDNLRKKVMSLPSAGSGRKNTKKRSDALKGTTSKGTTKKSENSKPKEKKRSASDNNHPSGANEKNNSTGAD